MKWVWLCIGLVTSLAVVNWLPTPGLKFGWCVVVGVLLAWKCGGGCGRH